MTYVKNAILGVLAMALIVGAAPVSAQTTADMQAQIAALLAQVQALTAQLNAGTSASTTFTRNLTVGSSGADVLALQKFLNANGCPVATSGAGSLGMESTYFGAKTKAAVACWQVAHNISPAAGYFGPTTRAAVNALVVVTPPVVTPGTTSPTGLTGGAGSVDEYKLNSDLQNEEVGEDANDVKVAGLEVEVSDGSDLRFTAVRLVFDEGTANQDFNDYADEVSIWLGSNEVARVNADDFTDDNAWTQTISLDSDAVVNSGDTETLYVAVSGAGNIDTNDLAETWTVDFRSVRFVDAQGASISEDPTTGTRTFSFESFATSADTEFKVTAGLDSVNKAHVIEVATSTENTDNVSILSFNVEIEGDSDITLDDLPINLDVVTQDNIDEMVAGLSLWMDGTEVASLNMTTDCVEELVANSNCTTVGADETYVFTDLGLELNGGSDYDFLVKADFFGTTDTGDLTVGDTIAANFGETQTDLANFDAEDESGTDLADADKTGTVTGEASEVRDIGLNLTLVSVSATKTFTGDTTASTSHDQGTFVITFDATAFGGNVYVDGTSPTSTAGVTASDVDIAGTETYLASSIVSPTSATMTGTQNADARFLVEEDTTERFTITVVIASGADGLFEVSLANLLYAITDADGDTGYTFNLDDFKTGELFLNFDEV